VAQEISGVAVKIEDLGLEQDGQLLRAVAKVVWEESDWPAQKVVFGVRKEFRGYLCCNGHAFLVGSILPAISEGERRIAIDRDVWTLCKKACGCRVERSRVSSRSMSVWW